MYGQMAHLYIHFSMFAFTYSRVVLYMVLDSMLSNVA